jgi:cation transport regulator
LPYARTSELPEGVKGALPKRGQRIFRAAFNAAHRTYGGNEERAFKVAWAAVKRVFKKKGGKWVKASQSDLTTQQLLLDTQRLYQEHWRRNPEALPAQRTVNDLLAQVAANPTQDLRLLRQLEGLGVPYFDFEALVQSYANPMPCAPHTDDFPGSLDHRIRRVCCAVRDEGDEYLGEYGYVLAVYPNFAVCCSLDEGDEDTDYWKVDYTFNPTTFEVALGDAQPVEVLTVVVPHEGEAMETPEREGLNIGGTQTVVDQEAKFKTDNGQQFSRGAYLIIGDPDLPSTWKVRVEETPGKVTVPQLGRAYAALTKGFRGNKVAASGGDKSAALGKLKSLYKSHDAEWPGDKQSVAPDLTGALNQDPQWTTTPTWLAQGQPPPGGDEDLVQTCALELEQVEVDKQTGVMHIRACLTVGNVLNAMGEVYPTQVWEDNLPFLQTAAEQGALLGESNHPPPGESSLDRSCILWDEVWLEGDRLMGAGRVLPTVPSGQNLQMLLQHDAKVDVSSRGKGTRKQGDWVNPTTGERYQDALVIQRGYRCRTFDAVGSGASPGATITTHEMAQQADLTAEEHDMKEIETLSQQVQAQAATLAQITETLAKLAAPPPAPTPPAAGAATAALDVPVTAPATAALQQAAPDFVATLTAVAAQQERMMPLLLEERKRQLLEQARTEHKLPQQWLNSYRNILNEGQCKSIAELEAHSERMLPAVLSMYKERPQLAHGFQVQQDPGERPGPKTPRQMIDFLVKDVDDTVLYDPQSFIRQDDETGAPVHAPDSVKTRRRQLRQILLNIAQHQDDNWNGPAALTAFVRLYQGYDPIQVKDAWMDQACADCTTSVAAGGAPSSALFIFPLVRAVYPQLIAPEIASIQPMDRPDGRIFFLNAFRCPVPGMDVVDQSGATISNRMFMDRSSSFSSSFADRAAECDEAAKIQLRLASVSVTATTKALTSINTIEELQDLRAYHGLDVNTELMSALSREIALEWNLTVLNEMVAGATASARFYGTNAPTGYTQKEWAEYLPRYIDAVSMDIFSKRHGNATHVIAGPQAILRLGAAYRQPVQPTGVNPQVYPGLAVTPWLAGTSADIKVYQTSFWTGVNQNTILVIRRGADWSDTGYVFAPYIDYIAPLLTLPDTFTQKQGVMSRAAHRVVVGDTMGTITIVPGDTGVEVP